MTPARRESCASRAESGASDVPVMARVVPVAIAQQLERMVWRVPRALARGAREDQR